MTCIRRALVLGLVLIAGTAIEQAPSVGPLQKDVNIYITGEGYTKMSSYITQEQVTQICRHI